MGIIFPEKTLDKMLLIAKEKFDCFLYRKLTKIKEMPDIQKKNRWFGYYQRFGEEKGYWTLDEVIKMVTKEKGE